MKATFSILFLMLITLAAHGDTQRYRVTIENTWSTTTHPGLFPFEAHFSWFGGGTHNDAVSFWDLGELASPGMVEMAETGFTTMLRQEINVARNQGHADADINQNHWSCPLETNAAQCGSNQFDLMVDSEWPLVTLVSMLGPSPDWFVGVDSLPLRDGGNWLNEVVIDLRPYDGGTRAANQFALFGPRTNPPEPISLITEASGQIITPASLGSMTFQRIVACDFTGDGTCDLDDLNAMLGAGPINPPLPVTPGVNDQFDLTNNGFLSNNDRDAWLAMAAEEDGLASPYKVGDTNLDGVVDGADFLNWNSNKFTNSTRWDHGDLDGNGVVDGGDFVAWNSNKFSSSDIVAVPESGTGWLPLLASWLYLRRRR